MLGTGVAAHCWGQGVRVASGDLCGKAAKAPTEAGAETNAHWQVKGGSHYRVKDEVPWRVEGSRPIGSRVKRLAQGELMPCVNSYWVLPDAEIRRFGGFAAAPLREKSTENGGMKIETDTAQRTLRQAWHL